MVKFNTATARPAPGRGYITTDLRASGRTAQGAPGYARDNRSELLLAAATGMPSEKTFHEEATDRDSRIASLVRSVAVADPTWMHEFVHWLRRDGGMRKAPLIIAAEAVKARLDAGPEHHDRINDAIVDAAQNRADEPGEAVAYWTSRYGAMPRAYRRGIARAALRLYTQRSAIKWDTRDHAYRFARVLDLVHPDPTDWQPAEGFAGDVAARRSEISDLFRWLHADMRGRDEPIQESLWVLRANARMWAMPVAERIAMLREPDLNDRLRLAGMTWENLASWLGRPLDAAAWKAIVPSMGFEALVKNIRNIAEADVDQQTKELVAARLADPEQARRSRMLPMQILAAYRAVPGALEYAYPLEQALNAVLDNVPALDGRTLILVDTSTSMNNAFSKDGTVMRWDAATTFGLAFARRAQHADVVSFSSAQYYTTDPRGANTKVFPAQRGESLLAAITRWRDGGYFLGGGTETALALRQRFAGHKRVVVLTDEQANVDQVEVSNSIPQATPMYTINLAGYRYGHTPGLATRVTIGALNDSVFKVIPTIERGRSDDWPWKSL